jgi:hypothetical protein
MRYADAVHRNMTALDGKNRPEQGGGTAGRSSGAAPVVMDEM